MKEMNWRLSSFLGGGGGRAQGVWVEDGVANAVCDPSVSSSVRLFTSHPGQEPRAPSWAGCRQLTRWAWRCSARGRGWPRPRGPLARSPRSCSCQPPPLRPPCPPPRTQHLTTAALAMTIDISRKYHNVLLKIFAKFRCYLTSLLVYFCRMPAISPAIVSRPICLSSRLPSPAWSPASSAGGTAGSRLPRPSCRGTVSEHRSKIFGELENI